jgi:hypothetical protein
MKEILKEWVRYNSISVFCFSLFLYFIAMIIIIGGCMYAI